MDITLTGLSGVLLLTPRRFADQRGHFTETWNRKTMQKAGLEIAFVQDNQSFSAEVGTVRGLHYQAPPHAQTKLVRALQGAILDVAVDVRLGSPSYGEWVAENLSAENGAQLLIPAGFLHGFVTLEPNTIVSYKVDAHYAPECEGAVRFDDPDLAIDWGISVGKAFLSDKDMAAPSFAAFDSPFRVSDYPLGSPPNAKMRETTPALA